MTEWTKVAVDAGLGGVAGVADQALQNWDEKRALAMRTAGTLAADKKMSAWKQGGTYLNYGGALAALVAVGTGLVKGDMATRLATIGGQVAGRKITHQFTTTATSGSPSAAYTAWQRAQAAANAAARGATAGMRTSVLDI